MNLLLGESVGTVAELWRYPVKGMRGERAESMDLDRHGIAGDRRFATRSSGAPRGKPLLSGAERAAMLLFAATCEGGETRVTSPEGEVFAIHDPRLLGCMREFLPGGHELCLLTSEMPLTDVRPVALLGRRTVAQVSEEVGALVDGRRFRANVLLDLPSGFAEDGLAGRSVRVGETASLRITERCPRCRMVTLDPATGCADPTLMKHLDRHHDNRVGVYGTVLQPGSLHVGDAVMLLGSAGAGRGVPSARNRRPT